MKIWAVWVSCILLCACASAPPRAPIPAAFFQDEAFGVPVAVPEAREIFALTDAMKRYVGIEIAGQLRTRGAQRGLLEALYSKQQLKLEYDAERTRNAAEAFEARSGNCLSLVIMTAALAQYLGMRVEYHHVYTDATWTRDQGTYFASGHVNLSLGPRLIDRARAQAGNNSWTVDFLPPEDTRGQRSSLVGEDTIVAMYLNNRAVEAMAEGRIDAAYWWARAAVRQEPGFSSAFNTLGVIYLRRGLAAQADQVLAWALEREPDNTALLSNLVRVQAALGRTEASHELAARLARLESEPPYYFFDRGRAALDAGDPESARGWFTREIARAPYHHEFHFWLAVADFRLGDIENARKQLTLAMRNSSTNADRQLYAAKLERLRQLNLH